MLLNTSSPHHKELLSPKCGPLKSGGPGGASRNRKGRLREVGQLVFGYWDQ